MVTLTDGQHLNVRSGPGVSYDRVGSVQHGDLVHVDGRDENWRHIAAPSGWVAGWLIVLDASPACEDYW